MSARAAVNPVRNVARWSALAAGLAYGYVHHNTLAAQEHNRAEQKKVENRDHLIAKAKAEWAKMNTPSGGLLKIPQAIASKQLMFNDKFLEILFANTLELIWLLGVITDPENPNFDLEKLLIHLSETA
ncbi:hypothetical protein BGZ65_009602 [Modicella reniformis]|uniref:ATP synthase F(0) complex subunit e, mitochondrial n=1 Tax=Modicella reniformis TaxID=1440133 RepID=A0A9P6IHW8_9FUNG|nr:hypothetical protein BGZ65_009602 [Modicella reniformis]